MQTNANDPNRHPSRTSPTQRRHLACLLALVGTTLLATAPARAADDAACAPLVRAETALHHADTFLETVKSGDRPAFKIVATPARFYIQESDGSWTYAKLSMATRNRMVHLFGKSKLSDCKLLRSDTIDGQAASVYNVTVDPRFGKKSTVTVWISRKSNLPLRNEGDVHSLFGGTHHMVQTFSYKHVQVPADAKEEANLDRLFGH